MIKLLQASSQIIVLERTGRSHNMSSSANDGLSSAYAGLDGICSQDSLCSSDCACNSHSFQQSAHSDDNSEDIKSTVSKGGGDPDSAELFHASDQDSCPPGSDNSALHDVSCQGKTKAETSSKKRRLRMMGEDSDGVRIKIIPCVREQFRRRMEATKVPEDDFYVPNRAQPMLDFLQKPGDRVVKETSGPKKRFRSTQACTACVAEILSRHAEVMAH